MANHHKRTSDAERSFQVQFNTDGTWAETTITASSLEEAIDRAAALDPDELWFEPFTDPQEVNEIIVSDTGGVERCWRSPDLLLRLAADDLLIAAKNVLTAMELVPGEERGEVIRDTLAHLRKAIHRAEGRTA